MPMPGAPDFDPRYLPSFDDTVGQKQRGLIPAAISSGIDQLQGTLGSALQGIGTRFDLPQVAAYGKGVADRNVIEAQQNGRPDLEGPLGSAPIPKWLAYQALKQVPQLVPYLAAGAFVPEAAVPAGLARVGAVLPKVFQGGGIARAALGAMDAGAVRAAGMPFAKSVIGAGIAGTPQAFGSMIQEADQKPGGLTKQDVDKAAALTPLYAGLDAIEAPFLKGGEAGKLVTRIFKKGIEGAALETVQEGLQTALEQSFRSDLTPQQKMNNIVNAAVTGGAVGGVFGGFAGLHHVKTIHPNDMTTDDLDKITGDVLALPPPRATSTLTAFTDAAGRTQIGLDGNELRATPLEPRPTDQVVGEYGIPTPPLSIESQTTIQPKQGSLRWAKPYDQSFPDRPFRDAPDAELQVLTQDAQNYLNAIPEGQSLTERDAKVRNHLNLMQEELQHRKDSETNAGVAPPTVEAVEPSPISAGGTQAAPASTNLPPYGDTQEWASERDKLLKGVNARAAYTSAKTPEELLSILNDRLNSRNPRKGDFLLAERMGVDTNERGASLATEEPGVQEQVQAAPVEPWVPKNKQFAARWSKLTDGMRDESILALKPNNREEMLRQVSDALIGHGRGEVSDAMERFAHRVGLLDEDYQLTPLGEKFARRPITMEDAVKEARQRGFTGSAASAFDNGARAVGEQPSFDNFGDMAAFLAGREWAAPTYRTASSKPINVESTADAKDLARIEGVPEAQQQQIWLSRAIDHRYDPTTQPAANAQLKTLLAQGASARELDDADRSFQEGRGILVNEPPERPRDPNVIPTKYGETYLPDPPVKILSENAKQRINQEKAERQIGAPILAKEQQKALVRHELMQSLKLAADNQDVAGGKYAQLRQAIRTASDRNDFKALKETLASLGDKAKPYIYIPSTNKYFATGRDWIAAADIMDKVADSDGSATTMMAHLAMLDGPIGNMAQRFAPYVPSDVGVTIATPEQMRMLYQDVTGKQLYPKDEVQGLFLHWDRHIYISTGAHHPATMLHEITHAIIGDHITKQTPIGREITKLFNKFKDSGPADDYAFASADEFMAEFLSRKQVRDYVRDYTPKSIFARAWQAIRKALGMPSRDYVEQLLNLAEAAGASPLGPSRYERGSPLIVNDAAKERIEKVTDGARTVINRDAAKGMARKAALGWATVHDIVEHWGSWFTNKVTGYNPVVTYEKALGLKQSIVARMAGMMTTARDQVQQLMKDDRKAGETLVRLMTMSEFGIDPTKKWAEQSDRVRNHANKDNLQKIHREAAHLYHSMLVTNGHAHIYQNLRNVNDVLMLSQLAVSLHGQVKADPWGGKLDHFAGDPMERFMEAQEHEDFTPVRARQWWNEELQGQLTALDGYMVAMRTRRAGLGTTTKDDKERKEIADRTDAIETRVKKIRETVTQMEEAPYFHLGRFGNYFVTWHVQSPEALGLIADHLADKGFGSVISKDSDRGNVYIRTENMRQRADIYKAIMDLDAQHKGAIVVPGTLKAGTRSSESTRVAMADKWFDRMITDIRGDEDIPNDVKDRAIKSLQDLHMDIMPENSLSRVMTHREGVPGYDADMLRAFEHRANVGINALAGMSISPKITEAFRQMRDMIDKAEYEPLSESSLNKKDGMRNVVDELSRREKERPQWPETKLLDQLRAGNHAFFLGFSVSYGVVNFTQLGATLLPELAARHGFVKTVKAIGRVTPVALAVIRAVISEGLSVSLGRAQDAVITRSALDKALTSNLLKRAGIKGDTAEFIMRVANTGQLDIGGASRELMRAAAGRGDGHIDNVLRYASSIGYYSETLSRLIAALASRELNPEQDVAKAAERASYVLKETMWDYSQANQGRQFGKMGFAGRVTPLVTAFMQYQAQLTGKLYREVYEAIKGKTPNERKEARRFLAYHLGAMTVLAGSLGLPMATAFAAAFDRLKDLFDDDDEPSNIRGAWRNMLADTFGKEIGEVLARGAPRLAGVDISQRVGEQDIVPFSRMLADRRKLSDAAKDMQARSWGAPSSMLFGALQGMGKIADGDLLGGMAQMMPNALSAEVKAYQMSAEGKYVDATGKELPIPSPGGADILKQALGFQPSVKAEYAESRNDQTIRKGQLTRDGTLLRNQMVKAVLTGDRETGRNVLDQIRDYNRANPGFAITGKEIESAVRRRTRADMTSKLTGTPLGTSVKDPDALRLTRYANIDYPAQ